MKCDKKYMLPYAVTDRSWVGAKTLYQQVEEALRGGVTCVQLREKDMSDVEFLQEAKEIHALCQKYGVPFIVNDNVEIAVACGAEGIHVGQEDMEAGDARRRVGAGEFSAWLSTQLRKPGMQCETARITWGWEQCFPPALKRM